MYHRWHHPNKPKTRKTPSLELQLTVWRGNELTFFPFNDIKLNAVGCNWYACFEIFPSSYLKAGNISILSNTTKHCLQLGVELIFLKNTQKALNLKFVFLYKINIFMLHINLLKNQKFCLLKFK